MKKIVHYIGLGVHKETVAVGIALKRKGPICSLCSPGGAGK